MASYTTTLNGAIVHSPNGTTVPSGQVSIVLRELKKTSTKHVHKFIGASGDVDTAVSFDDLTNAKLIVIQKLSGTMDFKFTSASGTDQILPIGQIAIIHTEEVPVTAIKYTGTGEFEVFLAEW